VPDGAGSSARPGGPSPPASAQIQIVPTSVGWSAGVPLAIRSPFARPVRHRSCALNGVYRTSGGRVSSSVDCYGGSLLEGVSAFPVGLSARASGCVRPRPRQSEGCQFVRERSSSADRCRILGEMRWHCAAPPETRRYRARQCDTYAGRGRPETLSADPCRQVHPSAAGARLLSDARGLS
jgi:hypothetical protein